MTASPVPTPDTLLRLCAGTAPAPWYPSRYAKASGTDRDALDEPLNRLRLAGLVRLTDWEPGVGQGYALTDAGRAVLDSPRAMARLRDGEPLVVVREPSPAARPDARPSAWDRGEAVRNALLSSSRYAPVNTLLIAVQVLVFAAGLSVAVERRVPLSQYLADGTLGGNVPALPQLVLSVPALVQGEWWRLLTSAAVHFGALHLFFNLFGHVSLGPVVERMYGSPRYLVLYLFSALGGSVCAALLAPMVITAGSSGALCGMIGGFGSFIVLNRRYLDSRIYAHSRRWLVNTLILVVMFSLLPRVSWQAHLGGAAVGAIAGALLTWQRFGTPAQRWAAVLGLVLLPIACVAPLVERGVLHVHVPRSTGQEVTDFEDRLVPAVARVRQHTDEVLREQVEPLREVRPERRDAAKVQAALAALEKLKSEQESARQFVAKTGPYHESLLEKLRQLALGYLTAQAKVTELAANCLRRGEQWNAQDEEQFQQRLNLMLEAELFWRRASRVTATR